MGIDVRPSGFVRLPTVPRPQLPGRGALSVGPDRPEPAEVGDLWFRTHPDAVFYIYYDDGSSAQWVTADPGTADAIANPPRWIEFPNPPLTLHQTFTGTNGITYIWDGEVWVAQQPPGPPNGPSSGDISGDYPGPITVVQSSAPVFTVRNNTIYLGADGGVRLHRDENFQLQLIAGGAPSSPYLTVQNNGRIRVTVNPLEPFDLATKGYVDATGIDVGDVAGGDLVGFYPDPLIRPLAVTDAKVNDVGWSKITGIPGIIFVGTLAGGDLEGTYPDPQIRGGSVDKPQLVPGSTVQAVNRGGTDDLAPGLSLTGTEIVLAEATWTSHGSFWHALATLAGYVELVAGGGITLSQVSARFRLRLGGSSGVANGTPIHDIQIPASLDIGTVPTSPPTTRIFVPIAATLIGDGAVTSPPWIVKLTGVQEAGSSAGLVAITSRRIYVMEQT